MDIYISKLKGVRLRLIERFDDIEAGMYSIIDDNGDDVLKWCRFNQQYRLQKRLIRDINVKLLPKTGQREFNF